MYNNGYSELYHYGIQGQKWGMRRYQNPDGSLTQLGKQRYGYYDGQTTNRKRLAKDYQKELNRVDKQITEESRNYNDAAKKLESYESKKEKRLKKGKNVDKQNAKIAEYKQRVKESKKNIELGEKHVSEMLKANNKLNLSIKSTKMIRTVANGKDFVSLYARSFVLPPMLVRAASSFDNYHGSGNKYRVKEYGESNYKDRISGIRKTGSVFEADPSDSKVSKFMTKPISTKRRR